MRILYVCENYFPMVGGAEYANQMICEGLAARGHTVTVITHQPAGAARNESMNGVTVIRVPCKESRYIFTIVALPTIVKHAQAADLIHTSTFNAAPPSWLAARLTGRRVICTVWETWIGRWKTHTTFSKTKATLHETLERAIFAFPYDRYVTISQATKERLSQVLPDRRPRISCVYLGFDSTEWKVASNGQAMRAELGLEHVFLIVGYGRPGVSKGFNYLVEAVPRITQAIPNAVLLLILSEAPQYREELAFLKAQAGSNVIFVPSQPRDRLVRIVKSADCVVVPSITEGFGYTTLEACSSGVPVVASRTTSIPEVISGSFVFSEPRDVESIANAVISVQRGQFETLPERNFSWSATIDGYEGEYRNLLSSKVATSAQPS